MKKILVPTDFSDCAVYATEVAMTIAQKASAEIHFFHMMGVPSDWVSLDLTESKLYASVTENVNKANSYLDELVKMAEAEGLTAKKMLQYDVSFRDILNYVDKAGIDFVVMGSEGAGGLDFLIGSNTQKVSRYCPVPLLVVNGPQDGLQIKNIIYATDLDGTKSQFHQTIKDFADVFGAKVHGLYVNTPFSFIDTPTSESRSEEFCSTDPSLFESFTTYDFKTEEEGILHFSKKLEADIIVLVTESRNALSRAFDKSITEAVISHSKTPVLSLNANP